MVGFVVSFQHDVIQNKLNELFNSLAMEQRQVATQVDSKQGHPRPFYETQFPELFFY